MSLHRPYVPEDFESFWADVVQEARSQPLDYHRSLTNDWDLEGFDVERIDFRGMHGAAHSGWFAYPHGARRLPAFLWLPPYGRESLLPNEYGTRPGFASMSYNMLGLDAFHQENYYPQRGYFAEGIADPNTWIYRSLFQNAYMAARVLQAQIEVDEGRCGSMGFSQGGGMSIWLGAHCPIIGAVCSDMPFLCSMGVTLSRHVHRYPLKEISDYADSIPLGMERVRHTLGYYDTVNQATRCRVPTHVALGLKDPAVRADCVESVFAALPGEKVLRKYEIGHDWYQAMVDNNRQWLLEKL